MNNIYVFTLFPIELIYKYIYLVLSSITENYGWALLALSVLNYFLLMPLNKLVRGQQESENNMQQVLEPQLRHIKETSRDAERHQRIQNLYQRYSYHPIFALRNVFPLLVQLPFLMAVYFMLSSLPNIEGVSFLFLRDLASPDGMIFDQNIMPVIMTLVSLVNACFVVSLSRSQKIQAIIVSLLFLALLYNAPSALLLYWTMNNVMILSFGLLGRITTIKRATHTIDKARKILLPSLLDSSALFIGLCFSVPLLFTISHNVNFFNNDQIVNLVKFIIAVLCGCLIIGSIIDKLIKFCALYSILITFPCTISIRKNAPKGNEQLRLGMDTFVYLMLALAGSTLCLVLCINIRLYFSSTILIISICIASAVLLFLIMRKYHLKGINMTMLSLLVFCCIQFASSQHKDDKASLISDALIIQNFQNFPIEEKMHLRPNIYIVYLESYMSSHTLRTTYNYNNTSFENALMEKGFKVYDNHYSHAAFTKGSLLSLFLMNENVFTQFAGSGDVISNAHTIISGGVNNLLFNFLKKNEYSISTYYDSQDYYIKSHGKLLDHAIADIDNSYLNVLESIAPRLLRVVNYLNKSLLNKSENYTYMDIYPKTFKHIEKIATMTNPSFFLIKPLNKLHIDVTALGKNDYQKWISSGEYQRNINQNNEELLSLVNVIEKNDPDALVILLGDHGHRYTLLATFGEVCHLTLAHLKKKYPKLGMTSQEIVDDMYSVFCAIKMPKNTKRKEFLDSPFAYSDLFKHIFAALDDNPAFLKHKSKNISFDFSGHILVRDHKPVENGK